MGDKSGIEWTDATWNPVLGCRKVSEGCRNCYAMKTAWRMMNNPNKKIQAAYAGLAKMTSHGPEWTGRARFIPERLEQPLRWRKPRRIFVNSMSDLFHEDLTHTSIMQVFMTMMTARQHIYQVLTKRPERMRSICQDRQTLRFYAEAEQLRAARDAGPMDLTRAQHIWLGVSVESRDHIDRIDILRETPAAVRWLSCEPLLGSLGELDLTGIDWVVVGGESGPGARPMHPAWAREIRDQCEAQGVAFFFKQWGAWMPSAQFQAADHINPDREYPYKEKFTSCDLHLRMVRVGKGLAGRVLDGRTHDAMPGQAERAAA